MLPASAPGAPATAPHGSASSRGTRARSVDRNGPSADARRERGRRRRSPRAPPRTLGSGPRRRQAAATAAAPPGARTPVAWSRRAAAADARPGRRGRREQHARRPARWCRSVERRHDPDVRVRDQVDRGRRPAAGARFRGRRRPAAHRARAGQRRQRARTRRDCAGRRRAPDAVARLGQVVGEVSAVGDDHAGRAAAGGDGQAQAVGGDRVGTIVPFRTRGPPEAAGARLLKKTAGDAPAPTAGPVRQVQSRIRVSELMG